jgi:hypothetical protein
MWMVEPEFDDHGECLVSVISLDSILHPAHLIGVYGDRQLPQDFKHANSLLHSLPIVSTNFRLPCISASLLATIVTRNTVLVL